MGRIVMYIFFAMSGHGLVISYIKNEHYINVFFTKIFNQTVYSLFCCASFIIYRYFEGIDQVTLFKVNGLYSFVPTSWYIWTLSYFYIFYFLVFRYVKSNIFIKVVLTCALVSGYIIIAPLIGIESWRYTRCPAFCIGMLFGLFDNTIRTKFVRWHALIALALLVLFFIQPLGHSLDVCIYPIYPYLYCYQ